MALKFSYFKVIEMNEFLGKVAVITGAGSGIGRALAVSLAQQGCNLALADINTESLEQTQVILDSDLFDGSVQVTLHTVDVSQWSDVQALAESVKEQHGRVNLLINNAGVGLGSLFKDASLDDMRWVMDINYWGVVYGCKAFLPLIKKTGGSTIVNVSSVFGLVTVPMSTAYCSSKFAVRGFSDALRHEVGYMGSDIKVACAFPSGIKTAIAQNSKVTLHTKSKTSVEQQKANMEAHFLTTPEQAATDILNGVRKGKSRIKVGKGSTLMDLASRLFPVNYIRFFK
jgi:short-subunit dehydrogenase|tara:strand:+ start:1989 stop:2843 length:855 start_codon:yes stop_codon:yes gene_type:complete